MRDNWVRVRFGLYKDDLAKVVDVDNASQRASILLLPRLDLNAMANRVRGGGGRRAGTASGTALYTTSAYTQGS